MSETLGFLTLLPPVIAIVLAILTRQVFISLIVGIFLGYVILAGGNPWLGFLDTLQGLVDVFADAGNTRTIMFCALVGALIVFMQRSGGVNGFIESIDRRLRAYEDRKDGSSRIVVQLLAWITGVLVFVESSISVLTVGTLYRPIFDKLGLSREKLAYIADSSSAPSSILIPFNGWGAFIMTLLAAEGFANPFGTMLQALSYNFYAFAALALVPIVVLTGVEWGPMKHAERRARAGKVLNDNAQPVVDESLTSVEAKEGIEHRAFNMVVPIVVMVVCMPFMLAYTGWADARTLLGEGAGAGAMLFQSIGSGSGSTAVLTSVTIAILVSMAIYKAQGIFGIRESVDLVLKGIAGLIPLALLMLLAFAIGALCKKLETGIYVSELARGWLSPGLVPFLVFVVTCFIAFSTGTSWGTFAIMIPIAVPMAQEMDANVLMAIAAVLGGGVFGDHCSPISDTTILSSLASATDHIDHVKTQLPYAGLAGGIAAGLYLILGLM
ncbi:Na+/H+ antiporter NhaC [Lewinella marina]|uniref:Sodium:solute symporter n=1 Tax=Neolewinella marina TaxID=438751 RepID=A0A2G0CK33_9BACT|nr:Na+/H+ antiporter NhaC family protein [Neolewinella marina]NJB84524.1 Na+/H+ antiporter NhaC [Neolewinella marina]PHL00291.1 sodium:solute symporter [Neolewinella marina]